jgi:hypothetical protein
MEDPKMLTEEEKIKTKQRESSDTRQDEERAEKQSDGRLEVTRDQYDETRGQHPKTRFFREIKTAGGVNFKVCWDEYSKQYDFYMPGMENPLDEVISLGPDREFAESVYHTVAAEVLKMPGADSKYIHRIAGRVIEQKFRDRKV